VEENPRRKGTQYEKEAESNWRTPTEPASPRAPILHRPIFTPMLAMELLDGFFHIVVHFVFSCLGYFPVTSTSEHATQLNICGLTGLSDACEPSGQLEDSPVLPAL